MPVTASARKKMRQDKKRRLFNLRSINQFKKARKDFEKKPSQTTLRKVFSLIDMLLKKKIIHKNKAARLKSRLAKKIKITKEK